MSAWKVLLEELPEGPVVVRHCLEVDPRRKIVRLAYRVEGSGDLEIQHGAVARSFFEEEGGDRTGAGAWLESEEAQGCLDEIAEGYHCDILWTGDPIVRWSEASWEAGNRLFLRLSQLLRGLPEKSA